MSYLVLKQRLLVKINQYQYLTESSKVTFQPKIEKQIQIQGPYFNSRLKRPSQLVIKNLTNEF